MAVISSEEEDGGCEDNIAVPPAPAAAAVVCDDDFLHAEKVDFVDGIWLDSFVTTRFGDGAVTRYRQRFKSHRSLNKVSVCTPAPPYVCHSSTKVWLQMLLARKIYLLLHVIRWSLCLRSN